jgi:hypothetical protein
MSRVLRFLAGQPGTGRPPFGVPCGGRTPAGRKASCLIQSALFMWESASNTDACKQASPRLSTRSMPTRLTIARGLLSPCPPVKRAKQPQHPSRLPSSISFATAAMPQASFHVVADVVTRNERDGDFPSASQRNAKGDRRVKNRLPNSTPNFGIC